jgi:aspartate/methionine/tyrosine aminotransferase
MERARVVVTPGRDFGQADPSRFIRFSTASSMAQLKEAIDRLETVLA